MYNRSIYDEFITFAFNVRMNNSLTLVLSFDKKKCNYNNYGSNKGEGLE